MTLLHAFIVTLGWMGGKAPTILSKSLSYWGTFSHSCDDFVAAMNISVVAPSVHSFLPVFPSMMRPSPNPSLNAPKENPLKSL
jgi:hypothetical protein